MYSPENTEKLYFKLYNYLKNDKLVRSKKQISLILKEDDKDIYNFMFDIFEGRACPWISNNWSEKLDKFNIWKQFRKDIIKERDYEHVKTIIDKSKFVFISFDGDQIEYFCSGGKKKTVNSIFVTIISENDDLKYYPYMVCKCNQN